MNGWLRRYTNPVHPRVRMICFPHAGGSANGYRPWRTLVPPDVELVAVQYPGRHDRFEEPLADTMDELVGGLLAELGRLGDLPAIFLGHSMGASVAYETTRRLGWKPRLLVVSARPAPGLERNSGLHQASDNELLSRLERLGGLPPQLLAEPELLALVMPALRADYRVIETYAPNPDTQTDIQILATAGDRDPEVSVDDVRGWQHATTAGFTLNVFPGGHFYIDEHAETVINAALDRVYWTR